MIKTNSTLINDYPHRDRISLLPLDPGPHQVVLVENGWSADTPDSGTGWRHLLGLECFVALRSSPLRPAAVLPATRIPFPICGSRNVLNLAGLLWDERSCYYATPVLYDGRRRRKGNSLTVPRPFFSFFG